MVYLGPITTVFIEGEQKCSTYGGNLASVTDERTQDYLVARNNTVWIGGIHLCIFSMIMIMNVILKFDNNSTIDLVQLCQTQNVSF